MTPIETVLLITLLLFTKHFIVDFPLQVPYHYLNKGTYWHLGGVQHSQWHAYGTFLCLVWFVPLEVAGAAALFDMILHYHIDWAKMNLNKKLGLGPTTSERFWWLLGADQFAHALTYLVIVWWVASRYIH